MGAAAGSLSHWIIRPDIGASRTLPTARAEVPAGTPEARRVVEAVGCEQNTASCLRGTPVAELLKAYGPFNEPRPVSGTKLMPLPPAEALRTGRFNRVPALDTARLLAKWTPTRMYEFSERDTPWFRGCPAPSSDQRAQHMSELAYLVGLDLFQDVKAGQAGFRDRLISTWVGFAESGRTDWPGFRGADGHVQTLASDTRRRADFALDHHDRFWKSLG
ncbi:hypothetical protein ACFU98_31585 [Streptomyces sp. NPDC057575]|uniref:hypothetical protein n=1 Tax=unclassified Streptomyces TaxID=2593676 RepID=UPI0036B046C2